MTDKTKRGRGEGGARGGGEGIKPKTSFFCHFLKFGLLVFLKMAYSDKTSNTGKIHEKNFLGSKFGPKTTISYKIFETNSSFHLI